MNNKTPIVIVGGSGRLGSAFVRTLSQSQPGRRVINVDAKPRRKSSDNVVTFTTDCGHPSIECVDYIRSLPQFSLVLLAAAITEERDGAGDYRAKETFDTNVIQILRFCHRFVANIDKIVFSSSVEVYGQPEVGCHFQEEQVMAPNTAYGISKLMGELGLQAFCKYTGKDLVVLRFSSIYGSANSLGNAVIAFCNRALNDEIIPVFGGGTALRGFIHENDAAQSLEAGLRFVGTGIFNIEGLLKYSVKELAKIVVETVGKGSVELIPDHTVVKDRVMSTERMTSLLQFYPNVDIRDGIRGYVNKRTS